MVNRVEYSYNSAVVVDFSYNLPRDLYKYLSALASSRKYLYTPVVLKT